MNEYRPDAILYVVGAPQADHFEKLFAAARLWGYTEVELTHVAFGSVLGEDGKIFRTRAGDTVSLESLIDEAVSRAAAVVGEFEHLSAEERAKVAEVIGPSAIKYADLSHARTSDYVFSFDKMVALRGNTATYMQYSYARVRSIFAKAELEAASLAGASFVLSEPAERSLAVSLLRFGDALAESMVDYRPNLLAAYLFDLAKAYSDFYEACPVLNAEEPLRTSRLALCDLTARTLRQGLELLGIPVVERM